MRQDSALYFDFHVKIYEWKRLSMLKLAFVSDSRLYEITKDWLILILMGSSPPQHWMEAVDPQNDVLACG